GAKTKRRPCKNKTAARGVACETPPGGRGGFCRRDRLIPASCVDHGGVQKRNGGPKAAVSFAESISLSSTVLVDLRLPPTALELGFVLLALRARRARESRCLPVPAQEVRERKMPQFARSALVGPLRPGLNRS